MSHCVDLMVSLTFLRAVSMIKARGSYIAFLLPHLRADGGDLLTPLPYQRIALCQGLCHQHHFFSDGSQHEFRLVGFLFFQQTVYHRDDFL